MDEDQHIWRSWANFLQRWGVEQWAASGLEVAGPLCVLGAQAVYLSTPLLRNALPADEKSETRLTALMRDALEAAATECSLPGSDPQRDAVALYDLAIGWMQRALAAPLPASEADGEALVAFALGGLRRGA